MSKKDNWSQDPENKTTLTLRLMANLSLRTREKQFQIFKKLLRPNSTSKVLDVGISANEALKDTNFFERRYSYPENLTAASIEDCQHLKKVYPKITFKKINVGEKFPFKNDSFDVVVSWATLEHVGERKKQKFFLNELFRVGKKVFITTPDKACFYEPHLGLPFIHWLPDKYFRLTCRLLGKKFWADINNLNPLTKADLKRIVPKEKNVKILRDKIFGFIPSHFIVIGK